MDNKKHIEPTGFSTPPSYFDELPTGIMNRIHSAKKRPFLILRPSFALASLTVISCMVLLFILLKKDAVPAEILLSENDIEHVVQNPELYNISDDVITEEYLSANISYDAIDEKGDVSDDEIQSFLEENSNTNNIINEY